MQLAPSLVGQKLSRLFGFGKAANKASICYGVGIKDRRDGMAKALYREALNGCHTRRGP